jgi:hypothetical protein
MLVLTSMQFGPDYLDRCGQHEQVQRPKSLSSSSTLRVIQGPSAWWITIWPMVARRQL